MDIQFVELQGNIGYENASIRLCLGRSHGLLNEYKDYSFPSMNIMTVCNVE
jgi:hypothetical protein